MDSNPSIIANAIESIRLIGLRVVVFSDSAVFGGTHGDIPGLLSLVGRSIERQLGPSQEAEPTQEPAGGADDLKPDSCDTTVRSFDRETGRVNVLIGWPNNGAKSIGKGGPLWGFPLLEALKAGIGSDSNLVRTIDVVVPKTESNEGGFRTVVYSRVMEMFPDLCIRTKAVKKIPGGGLSMEVVVRRGSNAAAPA